VNEWNTNCVNANTWSTMNLEIQPRNPLPPRVSRSDIPFAFSAVLPPVLAPFRGKTARHSLFVIRQFSRAFTLIELLIVISIIALLAALVFPIAGAAKKAQIRNRARAELAEVETAIEEYKTKLGFYPPDNASNWPLNQLYFELLGVTNNNGVYQTLDGSAQIRVSALSAAFGAGTPIGGFMNCSRGGDEGPTAQSFLRGLKSAQFAQLNVAGDVVKILTGPVPWSPPSTYKPLGPLITTTPADANPWCYNSSSPRYNTKSFDLWIDVLIANQTNRICNWSDRPIIVSTPY